MIANIKETQLANLRVGQPVKFTVDALNDKAYQGRVESISGHRRRVQRYHPG